MVNQQLDWMPFYEAVAHIERVKRCYQEKAIELILDAVNSLKARSRTFHGPPRLVSSHMGGAEILHEVRGDIIEVSREDVFRLWP
jgi:hypothetical protein